MNRFRYLNNNIIKDRCPIPLDATVMLGPLFMLGITLIHVTETGPWFIVYVTLHFRLGINFSRCTQWRNIHVRRYKKSFVNIFASPQQRSDHNSLWPSDDIWRLRPRSTLGPGMVCCLTVPSHYLNQCWLLISLWHWHESNFAASTQANILGIEFDGYILKITATSSRANELKHDARGTKLILPQQWDFNWF